MPFLDRHFLSGLNCPLFKIGLQQKTHKTFAVPCVSKSKFYLFLGTKNQKGNNASSGCSLFGLKQIAYLCQLYSKQTIANDSSF